MWVILSTLIAIKSINQDMQCFAKADSRECTELYNCVKEEQEPLCHVGRWVHLHYSQDIWCRDPRDLSKNSPLILFDHHFLQSMFLFSANLLTSFLYLKSKMSGNSGSIKLTCFPNGHKFQIDKKRIMASKASELARKKKIQKAKTQFKERNKGESTFSTILPQIPIIQGNLARLNSADSALIYFEQLERLYSQEYGAVKIKLSENIFRLNYSNLSEAINGHYSEGKAAFHLEKICQGVYEKKRIKNFEAEPVINSRSYTESYFWNHATEIKSIHFGLIDFSAPQKFSELFPLPMLRFGSIFPEKEHQFTYQTIFGSKGSIFAFHLDPYSLSGLNLLTHGGQKLWYILPQKNQKWMTNFLLSLPSSSNKRACQRIHHTVLIEPERLKGFAHSTIQNRGELILLFPGAYHSGVNLGTNICTTGTMATLSWLNIQDYPNCRCPFQMTSAMISRINEVKKIKCYLDEEVYGVELPVIPQVIDNDQQSSEDQIRNEVEMGIQALREAIASRRKKDMELHKKLNNNPQEFYFFSLDPTAYITQFLHESFPSPKNWQINQDHSPQTPLFIRASYGITDRLVDEAKYLQRIKCDNERECIQIPKPISKKCHCCNRRFKDYLGHINSKVHKQNLKNNWLDQGIDKLKKRLIQGKTIKEMKDN